MTQSQRYHERVENIHLESQRAVSTVDVHVFTVGDVGLPLVVG